VGGARTFQALYYLSSFFNQFGPNCTTWLGEWAQRKSTCTRFLVMISALVTGAFELVSYSLLISAWERGCQGWRGCRVLLSVLGTTAAPVLVSG
jgi:hypothetical protein